VSEQGFRLTVITQERTVIDREVAAVTAPGTEGYLGIWRNHAPLVTGLDAGTLTVRELDGRTELYAVSGGFLEVSRNVVTVLADTLESAGEIDPDRAKKSIDRALARLSETTTEIDQERVQAALKRNRIRMKLADKAARK
jgi:F-type H+-transporting ATPase subunit epsilon